MLALIACTVGRLKRRDSGCLSGEAAITVPSCSQLQVGWSAPQMPSSQ